MTRRRWLFRLAFFDRRRARQEMDEEIEFHLAARADDFIRLGMPTDAAIAEARRRFAGERGAVDAARRRLWSSAQLREDRMQTHDRIDAMRQDIRYALRGLRAHPGFAAAIILTLALGIGANSTIFSVVNAVLLRPLPYGDPDRAVVVWNRWTGWPRTWLSTPELYDYAGRTEIFESLSAYTTGSLNLTSDGEPERLLVGVFDVRMLPVLAVRPLIGRNFTAAEDAPRGPLAVLLSEELWRRRFAADPGILGRRLELSGRSYTVVGVLPAGFCLPTEFTNDRAQLFVPLQLGPPNERDRGSHGFNAVARLRPGVTVARAEARLAAYLTELRAAHSEYGPDFGITLVPVTEQVWGPVRPLLLVLVGAVGFVLLIGCANVANLLLARASARQQELSIRAALGAGRSRLVRQLLTESIVQALAGGVLGLLLAVLGVRLVGSLAASTLPRGDRLTIDATVLAYTAALSIVTGVLFGLAPVLYVLRGGLQERLRQGRGASGGASGRVRQLLVALEVSLAVVSTVGAALMVHSFARLVRVPLGFQPAAALTFRVAPPQNKYPTSTSVRGFFTQLLGELRALPGVRAAGAVNALPLATTLGDWSFFIEGRDKQSAGEHMPSADWQAVTDGYFEAMEIPVLHGRGFSPGDRVGSGPVVVVNALAARTFWPNESALGRRLRLGGGADTSWREVVGVVADVKHKGLDQETRPELYLPHGQILSGIPDSAGAVPRPMTVVIRSSIDPATLTASARRIVQSIDASLPIAQVRTLDAVFDRSIAVPKLAMICLLSFGVLSLALSAIGVYAVIAYWVARRRSEIGIRIALGARPRDVVRLVVVQGMMPALFGLAAGAGAAWGATRLMEKILFEVSARDGLSFAVAIVTLGTIALAATIFPARRAASVDPITALRTE